MQKWYKSYESGEGQAPIILIILMVWIICFIACYLIFWNRISQLQSENGKLEKQIRELSGEEEVTEHIWDWTCKWKWMNWKIQWIASCTKSDWSKYDGDVWNGKFNWKWIKVTENGGIEDGYFYNWRFIAWKITRSNGDSVKWLRMEKNNDTWTLEVWKIFYKDNWAIKLWDFDINWNLSYWMLYGVYNGTEFYSVWNLANNNNEYIVTPSGCAKIINWNVQEITRTVTNTVYANNRIQLWSSSAFWDLYKLWGKYNPYTVNLNIQ